MKKLITTLILVLGFSGELSAESSLPICEGDDYKQWTNCYGEITFPRNEYKGEWKDGKFDGKGTLTEAWGGVYTGDFKNNLAHGFGKQIEKDGTWWEGEVKNDLLNGKAIMVNADGSSHEGEWVDFIPNGFGRAEDKYGSWSEGEFKDWLLNGKGIYVNFNGDIYKGDFVDGFLEGQGTYTTEKGVEVKGEFKKDLLHGKGTWKFENGDFAKGNFKSDLLHGYGTITYANGDKYEGNFIEGYLDKGKMIFKSGDIYVGTYKEGLRDGKGTYAYENGDKYVGSYTRDLESGYGVYTWIDGDKYEGDWRSGLKNGTGKYSYRSGTVYTGDYKNNRSEGNGKIVYANGDRYVGEFYNGNEHGLGTLKYKNRDKYVGQFDEGYRHGKGKMVYANGDIYEGLWEDGSEAEGKKTLAKFTTDEKYYALIIGNDDYEKLEDLDNAVNDAKDLEKVLREKYGFETTLMIDKKSDETEDAIIQFTQNRDKNDNILIYYAGHGQLVKKQKRGYWLPTDAGEQQDSKWLSNNNIKDLIGSSDAKHILLIVDSCFAGSLMRGSGEKKSVEKLTQNSLERFKKLKTRLVMTSGGNELVADGVGNSKNSVFAEPLIKTLKSNNDVIRSIELFQTVQNYVINNADQTPNHSLIHGTGHNGGEFLFFPTS